MRKSTAEIVAIELTVHSTFVMWQVRAMSCDKHGSRSPCKYGLASANAPPNGVALWQGGCIMPLCLTCRNGAVEAELRIKVSDAEPRGSRWRCVEANRFAGDVSAKLQGKVPSVSTGARALAVDATAPAHSARRRFADCSISNRASTCMLLKEHRVPLRYTEADLEEDLAAHGPWPAAR